MQMLQISTAGGRHSTMPTNKRHVAIIGAGFAGLAAARTLLAESGGQVKVTILEADSTPGGRARRGQLASGPVELGATWFHGTEGNPVYDYAMSLISPSQASSSSSSKAAQQQHSAECQEEEKPKDYTANANGSDPRWELQLVAPGQASSVSGPRHQAILSAFEQYSLAVEDIAEDAEAAAAAAASAKVRAGATAAASTGDAAADVVGKSGAVAGCSLGQILRARFDSIMTAAEGGSGSSRSSKAQQGAGEATRQPARPDDVAAWLASDSTGLLKQSFAEGWGCRERLQRAYDGFHSADVAGLAHMTEYQDLDGPNIPVPGGYQSVAEALAAEAQTLGLQLHLNCPVDRVRWARTDGKVSLLLQPTAAATTAFPSSDSSGELEVVVDACVVTCSLGVLKTAGQYMFEPPLPTSKLEAIQQLQIGQVEKLFVEWPAAEQASAQQQDKAAVAGSPGGTVQPSAAAHAQEPAKAQHGASAEPLASAAETDDGRAPRLPATPAVGPRKPKPQQLHDVAPPGHAATAAASSAAIAAGGAPDGATAAAPGSATGTSAVADSSSNEPYTTYCLMWPTKQEAWGQGWLQAPGQDQQPLPMDVPAQDPVYVKAAPVLPANSQGLAAAAQDDQHKQHGTQELPELPEWLYGLHSWRYGDGPEWIKPATGTGVRAIVSGGNGQQVQPHSRSAVIWVTGRAAQQMGRLSDQQILQDLELLLQTYPAIPRPDSAHCQGEISLQDCKLLRSTWTSSPFFRGSYSYPSTTANGSTADALAAPLTCADAAAAGAGEAGSSGSGVGGVLVYFAGEATSRVHMGTVHGAFNSGVREAHRLLHSLGMSKPAEAVADVAGAQAPAEYHAAFWL